MTEAKGESDKCQKERERRRKKYKFALVKWDYWSVKALNRYEIEYKEVLKLKANYMGHPEIICDDQPERVLRGMLKLLKENEE